MKKLLICLFLSVLYLNSFSSCTIGVATSDATFDGRPVIFKNRDITSWSIEFKVVTSSGAYAYACNTSVGSSTPWMGVNEVGFGIVQSAAYNLSWEGGSGLGNGSLLQHALKYCETLADFEWVLDSTNATGRLTEANYAVIDASGNGAIYECANWEYAKYEPDSLGLVTHANFAYIGDSGRVGQNRMERAYELMAQALEGDSLNAHFIAKHVVTDLLYPGQDPYPLPWTGSFPGMPAGWVETGDFTAVQTICNANSHAAGVVQGVVPGTDVENSLLWCYLGIPAVSIPFPLFPAAYSEPPEGMGSTGEMLTLARAHSDSAFSDPSHKSWMNTAHLLDEFGEGILNFTLPTLDWAFDTVNTQIAEWLASSPTAGERSDFQDGIMDIIYNAYLNGTAVEVTEFKAPNELTLKAYPNPFNAICNIEFPAEGKIKIFDMTGRLVWNSSESSTRVTWQPAEETPNGIYLVQYSSGTLKISKKLIYMK
ncbi:T9SS type A sorting domain-containing protein [bacterium]|nr:T9SS type A sorting domain-containing protein [bacterium]